MTWKKVLSKKYKEYKGLSKLNDMHRSEWFPHYFGQPRNSLKRLNWVSKKKSEAPKDIIAHAFILSELGWMNVPIGMGNRVWIRVDGCSGFLDGSQKALTNVVFFYAWKTHAWNTKGLQTTRQTKNDHNICQRNSKSEHLGGKIFGVNLISN